MALAEFLGPCVIVSRDSVFSRFGFAVIDRLDSRRGERAAPGRPGGHRCERAGAHRHCVPAVRGRRSPSGGPRREQPAGRDGRRGRAAVVVPPPRLPDSRQLETSPVAGRGYDEAAAGTGGSRDDRTPGALVAARVAAETPDLVARLVLSGEPEIAPGKTSPLRLRGELHRPGWLVRDLRPSRSRRVDRRAGRPGRTRGRRGHSVGRGVPIRVHGGRARGDFRARAVDGGLGVGPGR